MIPFVDISYANGNYNMATNTDPMVMMKASGFYTGSLQPYIDSQLDNNYASAKKYNKIPFMYHFFVPAVDPNIQAAWFLRCVSPLAVGDGYALDVEIDGPNLVQDVLTFVTDHHRSTGCYPWVYIDRYLRQKYDWSPVFALCSEWIAAPDVPFSQNVTGVGVYVAQQGPIVNGADTDEYFGTLESLKSYTYGYHAPSTTAAPAPIVSTPQSSPITTSAPSTSSTTVTVAPSTTSTTVYVTPTTPPTVPTKQTPTETYTPPVTTGQPDKPSTSTTNTSQNSTTRISLSVGWWTRIWNWIRGLF